MEGASKLLKLVESGRLDPTLFATHRFTLDDTVAAYDIFGRAAQTGALKVVLYSDPSIVSQARPEAEPVMATV